MAAGLRKTIREGATKPGHKKARQRNADGLIGCFAESDY